MTRGTAVLYALIGAFAAALAAVPASRALQGELMAAQHLRPPSMTRWVPVQLAPKMYAFAHRVWLSDEPLTAELLDAEGGPPFPVHGYWLNHYPGRMAFEMDRRDLAARGSTDHAFVRSSYRGLVRESAFSSRVELDAATGRRRLVIRRREDVP